VPLLAYRDEAFSISIGRLQTPENCVGARRANSPQLQLWLDSRGLRSIAHLLFFWRTWTERSLEPERPKAHSVCRHSLIAWMGWVLRKGSW
jgi:hypothetical protein